MDGLLIAVAVAVAFFNGANDNIKGFAAAWGAGQIEYRRAVAMAATMNPGAGGTGAEMSRKMSHASARSVLMASRVRPEGRRLAVVER